MPSTNYRDVQHFRKAQKRRSKRHKKIQDSTTVHRNKPMPLPDPDPTNVVILDRNKAI